jgi:hypothetical protein
MFENRFSLADVLLVAISGVWIGVRLARWLVESGRTKYNGFQRWSAGK